MCYYIFCWGIPGNAVATAPYVDPNPAGPFSLEIKETIKKYQTKSLEHLNKLKEATGVEYNFLVDFEVMHRCLPHSVFKKRMVEIVLDKYLGALVGNVVEFVSKSEGNKQAFILKTLKRKIIFNPFLVKAAKPMEVVFEKDIIYIQLEPSEFGFLTEKTGQNLQALF